MSRKLLMNNFASDGLMPVQDGLICWLDGRDGQNGDTIWRDRSGNGNDAKTYLEINTLENGWLRNGYKLDGKRGWISINKINKHNANKFTIIIFFDEYSGYFQGDLNTSNSFFYFNTNTSYWSGVRAVSPTTFCAGLPNAENSHEVKQLITHSVQSYDLRYVGFSADIDKEVRFISNAKNDVLTNNVLNKNTLTLNELIIGCVRFNRDPYLNAKINSILIYNRALTDEEIQQNYEYEKSIQRG